MSGVDVALDGHVVSYSWCELLGDAMSSIAHAVAVEAKRRHCWPQMFFHREMATAWFAFAVASETDT